MTALGALRNLGSIARSAPPDERLPLLRAYASVAAKRRLPRSKLLRRERILGWTLEVLDYASFAVTFEDLFLRCDYEFEAGSEAPLIVDCGSNIGLSVLFFKHRYPRARILAFEPDPETFAALRRNVTENGLSDVELFNLALHAEAGTLDFYRDPEQPGSLFMSLDPGRVPRARRVAVEAAPLSRFLSEPVDFLKLDVEGAERVVLDDLARNDRLALVRRLALEYHHHIEPDVDCLGEVLRLLEEAGFGYQVRASPIRPGRPRQYQDVLIYGYRKTTGRRA